MEYLKSGIKSVLGSQQDAKEPTLADIVERLVERVQTSTLLDDRRDACRALKSLSVKYRLEVGAQALDALIGVLESDRGDNEILGYALETICNVISGSRDNTAQEIPLEAMDENIGFQFTEIFIKKAENVTLLLDLIEEFDFKVRWPVVRLLSGLLSHRAKDLQECILVSPMGVSRLMDLLSDTREIIRNDTLLLLEHLTKSNANIQKIVVFENAFDKLLAIISEEGYSDGGVIVGDCLRLMLALLKNNTSNQTFFKEGSYIKHLSPFFNLEEEHGWSSQKSINALTMLQIIRVLVSPNNPQHVTLSAQKAMFQCELLKQLCHILMASGVPADVLTETINTVAELIRGNHENQDFFNSVHAPTTPPRPALVVLLMSMVNDKQPFQLRCSVLYCFECFLFRNARGQAQIVHTLLPTTAGADSLTIGQLLCGGLFSVDVPSTWFAAIALAHSLVESVEQKEQLLRVQLAISIGSPTVSLIKQCALLLQQGGKLQTRLGLLILLCTWLANCTVAVTQFLSMPTNIPFLTSQVSLAEGDEHEDLVQGICAFLLGICIEFNDNSQPGVSKEDLCGLIVNRIGLEKFLDKLLTIPKNENYSRAAQNPRLKFKQPSDVLFDYEFCRLFKSLEGIIIKAVQPKPKLLNGPESSMTPEQQELLKQYKDLIREQDQKLQELHNQISEVSSESEKAHSELKDMRDTVQQLKDQNALLKAQRSVSGNNNSSQEVQQLTQEIERLKLECSKREVEEAVPNRIASEESDEPHLNHDKCEEHLKLIEQLQSEIEAQKKQIESLNQENQNQLQGSSKLEAKIQDLEKSTKNLLEEKCDLEEQLSTIKKEQEDMLILLTDQGDKISEYKKRLKELGQQVKDDDSAEDSEDAPLDQDFSDEED